MSTNNKVFQVLVTKSNQALATVGETVADLAPGQLGVFDAETGLAIDETATPKELFLAVGIDANNVQFSAGQSIQKDFVRNVTLKDYTAPVSFVVKVGSYKALNDMDYAIKLEFRNMQIYMRQGTNQFTKTFAVTTSADEDVEPTLDLAKKMLAELNNDADGLFTAKLYAGGVDITATVDTWATTHVGAAPDIYITPNNVALTNYLGINPKYYSPRQTVILPSLVDGFTSEALITTVTEAVSEQGNAYDIKQKEYKAGGWNGKPGPYRTSTTLGFPYEGLSYQAVDGAHYLQVDIIYDFFSTSGWGEYLNNLMTTIAIPAGDTVTIADVVTVLNGILGSTIAHS